MATGETKLSYLDVVDDIQDGDTVPILRDGKNYMSTGLAALNADLTDTGLKNFQTLGAKLLNNSTSIDFTLDSRASSLLIIAQGGDIFIGYLNARYIVMNNGSLTITANGDNSYTVTNNSTSNGVRYWTFIYEA